MACSLPSIVDPSSTDPSGAKQMERERECTCQLSASIHPSVRPFLFYLPDIFLGCCVGHFPSSTLCSFSCFFFYRLLSCPPVTWKDVDSRTIIFDETVDVLCFRSRAIFIFYFGLLVPCSDPSSWWSSSSTSIFPSYYYRSAVEAEYKQHIIHFRHITSKSQRR